MNEKRKEELRVKDLDYDIGFWIRGVVYVWVPGDTPETCHRYYLFHGNNENYFLFLGDDRTNPLQGSVIKSINPSGTKPLTPSFSLFPLDISDPDCRMVRNCFLAWVYNMNIFEVGEPRIEGVRLSSWGSVKMLDTFTIINPKTGYKKQIQLKNINPPSPKPDIPLIDIPDKPTFQQPTIVEPIVQQPKPLQPLKPIENQAPLDYRFMNSKLYLSGLTDVERQMQYSYDKLKRVHLEALLNRYSVYWQNEQLELPEAQAYKKVINKYIDLDTPVDKYDFLVLCHGRSHYEIEGFDKDRTVYVDPSPEAGADLKDKFPSAAFLEKYGDQQFHEALLVNCSAFVYENKTRKKLDPDFWNDLNKYMKMGGYVYIKTRSCVQISELSDEGLSRTIKMIAERSKDYGFEYEGCFETPFRRGKRRINAYTLKKTEESPSREFWIYREGVDPEAADRIFKMMKE